MVANVIVAAAGVAAVGALCAYFLWPAAPAVAMMKAPGAGGALISNAAFLANPKLYFHLLRHAGVKAALSYTGVLLRSCQAYLLPLDL